MEYDIIIGSNSDIANNLISLSLKKLNSELNIQIVGNLDDLTSLKEGQLVILDLSVYAPGIIERIQQFKNKFPWIELIAVTHTKDEFIDQMLVKRGIDQVACREELPMIVNRHINPLQTTG